MSNEKPKDWGEPWCESGDGGLLYLEAPGTPGRIWIELPYRPASDAEFRARVMACVNALRGIPDPAALLAAADAMASSFIRGAPNDETVAAYDAYRTARGDPQGGEGTHPNGGNAMSESTKLFPNATKRPWEMVAVAVVGTRLSATEEGVKRAAEAAFEADNILLTLHAVNTYDARDEALREATKAISVELDLMAAGEFDAVEGEEGWAEREALRSALANLSSVLSPGGAASMEPCRCSLLGISTPPCDGSCR
jgi:hypothetical protein